ncbi:glutamate decarboxylase GAD1 [Sugiyamaella lignohabitans]|uniref:Glutamate decarboxylase n=1 Tax=Sugiyamaella lignohabitans TaxID=796027 RepID=A0A167CUR4_9ASCO|nr:glutamate decarboxylase GAD1 [Sugiyamaella lignohabitans]ANB12129.1 glutamate decarboxylase GAD1 [Sugiyamaella lignohabitans]
MSLSDDVNAETLLAKLQKTTPDSAVGLRAGNQNTTEGSHDLARYIHEPIPKFRMQEAAIDKRIVASVIRSELDLDGIPSLNLASFVNTFIEEPALSLLADNIGKNLADGDEYPALQTIHQRCVAILSNLWNVPKGELGVGTATTGSSEAIHLGGLAMKRRWEAAQRAKGRDIKGVTPNIIMGSNAQVALEKFARYFDVTARLLPVDAENSYGFNPQDLKKTVDENTIGVFVIAGSTYTGHYQDVEAVSDVLDEIEKETGISVDIHVDGASGALVAPFVTPSLKFDFRIDRVKSINTSGHKFGLVTVGLGWIIWRDRKYLPEELLFTLHYLGGSEDTYTLNFSRPGFPVIHQYYNFVSLGLEGYRNLHSASLANARLFATFLEATGYFEVLSDIHRPKGVHSYTGKPSDITNQDPEFYNPGLPVVSFRFSKSFREQYPMIPQQAVSTLLRVRGYIIPNYPMPADLEDIEVLRVVVRASLSVDILDMLMEHIVATVQKLTSSVKDHYTAETESDKLYKTLLALTTSNPLDSEHPQYWDFQEETGTRSGHSHGTKC